jgi:NAD dependent epimerase/dehydratase family enzyme
MNTPILSLCCVVLTSCAASGAVVESAPEPAKPATVTTNVTKAYQKAAQKEIPVVIAPNATPERVRRVHTADSTARRALSKLEAQGDHPTKEALDAARVAVKQLSDVLSSSTEGEP